MASRLSAADREFLEVARRLAQSNPFLPERVELEREALGPAFVDPGPVWCKRPEDTLAPVRPNVVAIFARLQSLVAERESALAHGERVSPHEAALFESAAAYWMFERYRDPIWQAGVAGDALPARLWGEFVADAKRLTLVPTGEAEPAAARLLAIVFQIRRAFDNIFQLINGRSASAARLRGSVWQSLFTRDLARYRHGLYEKMNDVPTLIVGPSGTGKELVAQSIALSRFVPFDPATRRFVAKADELFHPLNLSAMSPTLIESELFGHSKGSFTGATADRPGWLERCRSEGTVFLDEIGELDPGVQVKLLRVLQTRGFTRVGETQMRRFEGKIVAATHRDLAAAMEEGSFRADFYYRLCADIVVTPSLHEQLADDPEELSYLVRHVTARVAGDHGEGLAEEATTWIRENLGESYPWPGNFRELEQCVRNVMIRGSYRPPRKHAPPELTAPSPERALSLASEDGTLTADQLLQRYCRLVFERVGSYEAAARVLNLDRRTVKAKLGGFNAEGAEGAGEEDGGKRK